MGNDNTIASNRIVYVDPNSIAGTINDTLLTPDYTGFSIWCNLVVERTSRLKNQNYGYNEDETYVASWDMTNKKEGGFVSFMQGKDSEAYNFLTTDYTNINFEDIKKRNIIEGLQIQSVNIAFVNYQTPQVTIKFVDIRGGGLFGREEATHNEYGRLSNLETDKNQDLFDNFFSCFVTFPYPRFKLQVKGFYGKPVTFQLTCTSFSGRLNASTGNFEITVQFIGYEYGLLGDIPFDLLVCAPLTEVGSEYWDEHVRNMANNGWALDKNKSEKPIKLLDFFYKISNELQNGDSTETREFTDDNASVVSDLTEQINELNQIKICIEEFKELVKKTFNNYYVTDYTSRDENVLVIYSPTELYKESSCLDELNLKYKSLIQLETEYIKKYEVGPNNNSFTTIRNEINKLDEVNFEYKYITFSKFIKHNCIDNDRKNRNSHQNIIEALDLNGHSSGGVVDSESSCSGFKISELYSSKGEYIISNGVSKQIYKDLSNRNWAIYGGDFGDGIPFAGYAVAISLGESVDDRLTELNSNCTNITNKLNTEFKNRKISDIVGFTPYIGRYFKVVMCHLETFMELIYKCVDGIYGDLDNKIRFPEMLGIKNPKIETDVPSKIYDQIPPFPAVYKKYTTNEEKDKALNNGKDIVANSWIGDFKGTTDWKEEYLVDDLAKAAKRVNLMRKEYEESSKSTKQYTNNSVFPIDYLTEIPKYAYTSIDGAMFYAALRAEIELDFMTGGNAYSAEPYKFKDWSYSFGVIDGYSYATNCSNKYFLNELTTVNNLSDKIYNATVYCDDFLKQDTDRHFYEFVKAYRERHPVFIENGDKVVYNYMTNDNKGLYFMPLVSFKNFSKNGFSDSFDYTNGNDFTPKEKNQDDFLYGTKSVEKNTEYPNAQNFKIIVDEGQVENIKNSYQSFVDGKINISDKSADYYSGVVKQFSNCGEGSVQQYYPHGSEENTMKFLLKSYKEHKIDDFKVFSDNDVYGIMEKIQNCYY